MNDTKLFNSVNSANNSVVSDPITDKEKEKRLRKMKILELNQEDSQKTALKKRSNKIFTLYLKEVDP
jgi:hypothetical protein